MSKHISEFNEGDIITRIKPALNDMGDYKNLFEGGNIDVEPRMDNSYLGDCLKYIGRTNRKIYCRYYSYKNPFKKGKKIGMNYEIFKNGWIFANESNFFELEESEKKVLDIEKDIHDIFNYYFHIESMEKNFNHN